MCVYDLTCVRLNNAGEVRAKEADDYFVFLISDANLEGYGVKPETLAQALTADDKVNAYAVFIAEEATALEMAKNMQVC